MPLKLIFCDSWDHYDVQTDKWDLAGTDCVIDLTGTKARTGIGCLVIRSAAFGPSKTIQPQNKVTVGTAYFSSANQPGQIQDIIQFIDTIAGNQNVRIGLNPDGSIVVNRGNPPFPTELGTSAAGVYQFNVYNYIEAQTQIDIAPFGFVTVRVNGTTVLDIQGVLTKAGAGALIVNSIRLMGFGGIQELRHDDTYIGDWTDDPGNPFYGAVRIYAQTPFEDAAPLEWTPSTVGPHYVLVDEIPPTGDTDFVQDDVIGQIDQYNYNTTGVPAASQIVAVQHVLDAKLDSAGSQSITSVVEDIVNVNAIALTTDYHMHTFPYDQNPALGADWSASQFPAAFGPAVVAP